MTPLYTQEEYNKAKSGDLLLLKCEHCGKEFKTAKKLITYEINHKRGSCKYCSNECLYNSKNTSIEVYCLNCGKKFTLSKSLYDRSENKHFFCCHSCSAIYNNKNRIFSEKTKEKISDSIKEWHRLNPKRKKETTPKKQRVRKERICVVCGKHYYYKKGLNTEKTCSKECKEYRTKHHKEFLSAESIEAMSKSGRKSITMQGDLRRSKNEIYFCELCKKHFKNVLHNEQKFNGWDADIIIEDIKVAVLWNGKWHYEKITEKHSVEQVQNRDKIKIEEIKKLGYIPYIIKDMGKYNPNFVENEFQKLIGRGSPVG